MLKAAFEPSFLKGAEPVQQIVHKPTDCYVPRYSRHIVSPYLG
ncbi:MAG: hypothetical protein R8M38_08390 [Mariprofundaceae bacterium]